LFESFLAANSPEELPQLRNVETESPKVFITSWVDYTHKYGTAYSLTDGTAGLYFNDSTTMVLSPDKELVLPSLISPSSLNLVLIQMGMLAETLITFRNVNRTSTLGNITTSHRSLPN